MAFQKPKGTEDVLPEEMKIRSAIFSKLRGTAQKYGFQEVSSPAFEDLDVLTKKEGEEIKQQIQEIKSEIEDEEIINIISGVKYEE